MDHSILKKGIQALLWESHYRKKDNGQRQNHFLAPTTGLDNDFDIRLNNLDILTGKALDVGTGTGEQSVFLAKRGFEVTATDVSHTALENACKFARANNADVRFVEDNILETKLNDQFDLIFDRGCFTILPPGFKQDYFLAIKKLLKINGWLFLKADKKKSKDLPVFSDDVDFQTYNLEESSYASLNGKIVPAIVLVTQRIR